ncbi:site-specific integrase [Streptomyces sp. WAC07149]|uniref:site-specific integrase n=1 Tax=Streptomyces sp. WAC07149 TaxID=2487425 RepID=UPI000F76678B|nr:tyrosine-type recombinase/integrase [Streptomyces sp. WAC07149]RST04583.1 site-specific integrase [Streptomyces sp. WAC07149]
MDNERAPVRKAANGEDSIYWDESKNRYIGAISMGFTPSGQRLRRKVSGRTKSEVRKKLRDLRAEMQKGKRTSAHYTVKQAVEAWLEQGLKGKAESSRSTYRSLAATHIYPHLGSAKLRELEADQVDVWLDDRKDALATTSLRLVHSVLSRSITHAQRRNRVTENVATLVNVPDGRAGRPSKSLSVEQGAAVLNVSEGTWIHAYVVLALLVGIRTEETRPLTWDRVHTDPADGSEAHIDVWRSVRRHGETKTQKSRRSLAMPQRAAEVVRAHKARQRAAYRAAGREWTADGLVFPADAGGVRTAENVRRNLRWLLKEAGFSDPSAWTTRELRTSFVSLLSDHGLRIEDIARLVGHSGTQVTEKVYRKQLRPVITKGAEAMDEIFGASGDASPSP